MKEINWKRKLTSRKLWTAVGSFVSMMILATGGTENTATQVAAIIMAGAAVRGGAGGRQPLRGQPQFILREEQPPCAQTRLPLPS
nr:MAG TPA: holin [Caudoviricetes sp.]